MRLAEASRHIYYLWGLARRVSVSCDQSYHRWSRTVGRFAERTRQGRVFPRGECRAYAVIIVAGRVWALSCNGEPHVLRIVDTGDRRCWGEFSEGHRKGDPQEDSGYCRPAYSVLVHTRTLPSAGELELECFTSIAIKGFHSFLFDSDNPFLKCSANIQRTETSIRLAASFPLTVESPANPYDLEYKNIPYIIHNAATYRPPCRPSSRGGDR